MAWHEPSQFRCELCTTEEVKQMRGCTGKAETPYTFGPTDGSLEAVQLSECPARLISMDVVDLFRRFHLAGGTLPLRDQEELPGPYLDALSLMTAHESAASAARIARARKH
jgi:hypothetical protein